MSEFRTLLKKITLLKEMHHIMQCMNHEDAYYHWIVCGVPDEPTEEDFESIAEDNEYFEETVQLFFELTKEYGKFGVWL